MAQITIYLPDELERKARKTAKTKGESVSRWIASQVTDALAETWPPAVIEAAGAIPDFPEIKQLRAHYGKDVTRRPF